MDEPTTKEVETQLDRYKAVARKVAVEVEEDLPGELKAIFMRHATDMANSILGLRWDTFDRKFEVKTHGRLDEATREMAIEAARAKIAELLPEIKLTAAVKKQIVNAYQRAYIEQLKMLAREQGKVDANRRLDAILNSAVNVVLHGEATDGDTV